MKGFSELTVIRKKPLSGLSTLMSAVGLSSSMVMPRWPLQDQISTNRYLGQMIQKYIPGDKLIDFEESFLFLQAFGNAPLDVL